MFLVVENGHELAGRWVVLIVSNMSRRVLALGYLAIDPQYARYRPMPYRYEIDVERRLVIATFSGKATIADAEAIMAELHADPRHSFALNRVYDCRALTRLPPVTELRGIAELFRQRVDRSVSVRRAIVVRHGAPYGLGRMLQTLLDLAGLDLSVFADLDEAISWATEPVPHSG